MSFKMVLSVRINQCARAFVLIVLCVLLKNPRDRLETCLEISSAPNTNGPAQRPGPGIRRATSTSLVERDCRLVVVRHRCDTACGVATVFEQFLSFRTGFDVWILL